jgi:hypothetical protein
VSLFGQTATLRRCTGAFNGDGTPVYGAFTTIRVRWEEGTQRAVTSGMETAFATYRTRMVFTDTELGHGDEVTFKGQTYHVAGVATVPTLDGVVLMWEAVME